jgi:ribosome biogenesis protein ERB1
MVKKLVGGAQWNSSVMVHPKGDNILVGSYDRKVLWYDLDLGTTPYKTMRYHERAVRKVAYH